jgi:predicted patatin/cPLA2 family phospholipase
MFVPYRKLALGGGGMKGILHVGILQELEKYQKLYFPDGIYGCSIGSILATCVAFEIPLSTDLVKKYLNFESVIPEATMEMVTGLFTTKGLFSMDLFEKILVEFFDSVGIDIRSKVLNDARMPLFVVTSNITKGIPTILSKNVSILDALKCSCCIPVIFKPQALYGQLYVDGGLFTPCLSTLVPDALSLVLTKKRTALMTPDTIEEISPIDYVRQIYSMSMNQFYKQVKDNKNILALEYPNLTSDSDLNDFNMDEILSHCSKVLNDFLGTKSVD